MTTLWQILALGMILGVRHALDPDHLVAVTAMVSEYRRPLKAVWIGVSWGLGHTATLLLVGAVLLLLNVHLPERLSLAFEFLVGVMLVILGIQTFWSFRRRKVHVHTHEHEPGESSPHAHFHSHGDSADHRHEHGPRQSVTRSLLSGMALRRGLQAARGIGRPAFRFRSFLVGTVHGLAGSAAVLLLGLATIESRWAGTLYILVFGVGTIVSMSLISVFISLPFSISSRAPRFNRIIQAGAGALSIVFGAFLMLQIGISQGLFTSI